MEEAVEEVQGGGVKTRGVVGLATLVLVLKMAAVMRMTAEEVLDTPTLVVQTTSFQALERLIAPWPLGRLGRYPHKRICMGLVLLKTGAVLQGGLGGEAAETNGVAIPTAKGDGVVHGEVVVGEVEEDTDLLRIILSLFLVVAYNVNQFENSTCGTSLDKVICW